MTNIILDCDPGHDDAIAILLLGAHLDKFNVLGVTTSCGNQTIDKTTKNALNVIDYLNLPFDVYQGSDRPLYAKTKTCSKIHGKSGLDGFSFKKHDKKALGNGVDFMINTLHNLDGKCTIITTGPMTNVAKVIKKDKTIKEKIEKIVLMGGSIGSGNVTPAAEFNINCDPEAASICFKSGIPIYMIGLDVTRKVLVLKDIIERIKKINNIASVLFVDLMEAFNKTQKIVFGLDGGPLHDPVTIASLIDDKLVTYKYVNVEIDTKSKQSYGRTNCDIPDYLHKKKNAYVATDIDVNRFWDIIEDGIRKYGE